MARVRRTLEGMSDRPAIRLLQIVDSLHAGGMENIMVQVCNRLDPEKFDVTVCCLTQTGPFRARLKEGVACCCLDKAPGFCWRAVGKLREIMRSGRYDLVHTHHLGGLIYTGLARSLTGGPRIIHSEHIILHGDDLRARRLWQRRLLYRMAACVFTVSGQQLKQLREVGLTHRRSFVLTNGVDCARFCPVSPEAKAELRQRLGLEPEGFWFGKVARFAPAKRHVALIEAFERAASERSELRLLLVGDGGPEKERVLSRIEGSPVRERIHWAGLQQDPVPWYQAMDALVIASESEGMPNAALEGMACGLPLLSHSVCGIDEVARDGEHGWIRDLGDIDKLCSGLVTLASQPRALLEGIGGAARAHVEQQFSMAKMIERYEGLYAGIAEP